MGLVALDLALTGRGVLLAGLAVVSLAQVVVRAAGGLALLILDLVLLASVALDLVRLAMVPAALASVSPVVLVACPPLLVCRLQR